MLEQLIDAIYLLFKRGFLVESAPGLTIRKMPDGRYQIFLR